METDKPHRAGLPLNLFGIPFGLAGLAGLWTQATGLLNLPAAVAHALWIIAAVAWCVTLGRYLVRAESLAAVIEDCKHPVLGPFASLAPVTATLFGERINHDLPSVGKVWVLATATLSFAFGVWFVSNLVKQQREIEQLHSGYLLPTVAAGLVSSQSLASVGFPMLSVGAFGTGILFWLLLGSITLYRLSFQPRTPHALIPTYAIFSAPPAVAGNAWFAIRGTSSGDHLDMFQQLLFGTFLFLIAFQILLIPKYIRLPFTFGFWAITFTVASSGRYAMRIIDDKSVPAGTVWEWLIALAATVVIGSIAAASIRSAVHGKRQFAPPATVGP